MGANRSATRGGRWLRRGVLALMVLPLVLFGGSNLVMRSAWFRGKLEARLTARTRLAWTVGEASWSPWRGLRLGRLKAMAFGPEAHTIPPIFEVAEVRVRPYWGPLVAGRLKIRELRVTEPRGSLPVELLVQLMRSDGRIDVVRLGVAASDAPGREEGVPDPATGHGGTDEETPAAAGADRPPDPARGARGGPTKDDPGAREEPEPEPPGRLVVERGDLEFYSMSARERSVQLRSLAADLPFSGAAADGWLAAAELRVDGGTWSGPLKLPLRWNTGVLEWPAGEFEWNGLTVQTAGSLRIRGRLAGVVELWAVAPGLSPRPVPGWESAMFTTGPVEIRARLNGEVLRPATWQGNLVAGVGGVQFVHQARGESVVFDRARLVTDLRGGVLQVVDGTLAGEQLSFFGNGFMVLDGRAYGVARVVAAPDLAEVVTRVVNGTRVTPDYVDSWLAPLVTPDRYYRDIHLQGRFPQWEFDLGSAGEWIDGGQAWRLIRFFVTREEAEEAIEHGGGKGAAGP